jgi:CTP synthase (UTP-ammonia lyase)
MKKRIQIGLVGDFSEKIHTLVALNNAITHAAPFLPFSLDARWIPTATIDDTFLVHHDFDGFWVVPGSPYTNDDGVYKLITFCRKNNFPLLGTCGGFQYMVVEYARNVLGFAKASHEESDPDGADLVISKLSCSLKGKQEIVLITDYQSWMYEVLKQKEITGSFYCSYGVNPTYTKTINQYPFTFTAFSSEGDPRAFELKTHRFFNGTLFQPPLDSTSEHPNPLLVSFFEKCAAH